MKKLILIISIMLLSSTGAYACTIETINSIAESINPYQSSSAGEQIEIALDTLGLCDENLYYAGLKLGANFNPYQEYSTRAMTSVINGQRNFLPLELLRGLGLGLINEINLYQYDSTHHMLKSILGLGETAPEFAKQFALELLKRQNSYQDTNRLLLQTARALRNLAPLPPQPPAPPITPPPIASPIWAFRTNSEPCDGVTGPWGYYERCPRYYSSISDQFGNRIVLACKSENFGIEFRVTLSQQNWSIISQTNIETMAFGTSSILQSLGVPYIIYQANTLMAQEPVANEILSQLRSSKSLFITIRSNSGEVNTQLNFSLQGSNTAIGQLLQYCR